jgi:hypothetical protein
VKPFVETLLALSGIYLGCGAVFAVWFHCVGLKAMDAGTQGAGFGFRLLITPGVIALWPLLWVKRVRQQRGNNLLGDPERPVAPEQLRRLHGLAFKLLAVLIPILVAAALWWRPPATTPREKLPPAPSETR